jgi:hypothetical protein
MSWWYPFHWIAKTYGGYPWEVWPLPDDPEEKEVRLWWINKGMIATSQENRANAYRAAHPELYDTPAPTGEDGEQFDYSKIDPDTGEPYTLDDGEDDEEDEDELGIVPDLEDET